MSAHRHRYGDSIHLEWVYWGELMRCGYCGRVWLRSSDARSATEAK